MFSNIVDPNTKKPVSLFGQEGGDILANYVKKYKDIRKQKSNNDKTNDLKKDKK
tara:strand:+ start:392 stop:553 length:162 start_codon:yes stop_codon:yes gene_type:complete